MTLDERVSKLEIKIIEHDNKIEKHDNKIDEHDTKIVNIEKKQLTDWYELSELITRAVEKGVENVSKELALAKCRIEVLEKAEGERAIEKQNEFWRTVRSVGLGVVVTFFATLLINNFIAVASSSTNDSQSVVKEEVK